MIKAAKDKLPEEVTTAPINIRAEQESLYFSSDKEIKRGTAGKSLSLHDEAFIAELASYLRDVIEDVRREHRIKCVQQKIAKPGEAMPPYLFKSKDLVRWIKSYYIRFSKLDSPECYFPGSNPPEPKITPGFKYYYIAGQFSSPIVVGKLLSKTHNSLGIARANSYGNAKTWLLNPPPSEQGS